MAVSSDPGCFQFKELEELNQQSKKHCAPSSAVERPLGLILSARRKRSEQCAGDLAPWRFEEVFPDVP